jgi:multidrug efflux pump subunit AcrA (membrane-fusion protein)
LPNPAAQKWILTSGGSGQLVTSIINYKNGTNRGYNISQFAREGSMHLTFSPLVDTGDFIREGDTIATIYSSETEENLADITGQLATLRATLAVDSNGEKESIVREYELRLAHAREAESNQRLILARQKALLEKNLISQQEYDIAANQESLMVVEIEIARAQLESARTAPNRNKLTY